MRCFRKFVAISALLLSAVCAHSQAAKTLYFTNTAIGTNIWGLDETQPANSAVSTTIASNAASTTGWYFLDPGLTDTTPDVSEPTDTTPGRNTLWVSNVSYNGNFASGNWVFTIRKTDTRSGRVGAFHVDLYRTTSQTNQASGATFITDCSNASDDWTGVAATITVTCSTAGTTTFTNEYLVLRTLEQVSTGSTSSGTWTLIIQDGTNGYSKLVTPGFTQASVPYSKSASVSANISPAISRGFSRKITASLHLDNAICSDLARPLAVAFQVLPAVSLQRAMHGAAPVSVGFTADATGTLPVGTPNDRPVTAAVRFGASVCYDRTKSFTSPAVGFSPTVSSQRGMHGNATASETITPSISRIRAAFKGAPQSIAFTPSVAVKNGFGKAVSASTNLSPALTLKLGRKTAPPASLAFTPAIGVRRDLRLMLTAGLHVADAATGTRSSAPKLGAGTASCNLGTAICINLTRAFTPPSVGLAPVLSIQKTLTKAEAEALHVGTSLAIKRSMNFSVSQSLALSTAVTGRTGPNKIIGQSLALSPVATRSLNSPGNSFSRPGVIGIGATCTVCTDLLRRMPQPGVQFGAVASVQKTLHVSLPVTVAFNPVAQLTQPCSDTTRPLGPTSIGFSPSASLCMQRDFPGETVTISPLVASSVHVNASIPHPVAIAASLGLVPVVTKSVSRNGNLTTQYVFVLPTVRMGLKRNFASTPLSVSNQVGTLLARKSADAQAVGFVPVLSVQKNLHIAPSIVMAVMPSAAPLASPGIRQVAAVLALDPQVREQANLSSRDNQGVGFAALASVQRGMHGSANANIGIGAIVTVAFTSHRRAIVTGVL